MEIFELSVDSNLFINLGIAVLLTIAALFVMGLSGLFFAHIYYSFFKK